jgi:hypothetical protein
MTKFHCWGAGAALLAGCASTQLEVARNDAADPNAAAAPPPAAPNALRAEFEPAAAAEPPQGKSTYTCPMHPEIKRSEPGQCPICGMNLVPEKKPKAEQDHEAHSHEHRH